MSDHEHNDNFVHLSQEELDKIGFGAIDEVEIIYKKIFEDFAKKNICGDQYMEILFCSAVSMCHQFLAACNKRDGGDKKANMECFLDLITGIASVNNLPFKIQQLPKGAFAVDIGKQKTTH